MTTIADFIHNHEGLEGVEVFDRLVKVWCRFQKCLNRIEAMKDPYRSAVRLAFLYAINNVKTPEPRKPGEPLYLLKTWSHLAQVTLYALDLIENNIVPDPSTGMAADEIRACALIAAILHDHLEDKHVTEDDLKTYLRKDAYVMVGIDAEEMVKTLQCLNYRAAENRYATKNGCSKEELKEPNRQRAIRDTYCKGIVEDDIALFAKTADLTQNLPSAGTPLRVVKEKPKLIPRYFADFAFVLFPKISTGDSFQRKVHSYLSDIVRDAVKIIASKPGRFAEAASDECGYEFTEIVRTLYGLLAQSQRQPLDEFEEAYKTLLGNLMR